MRALGERRTEEVDWDKVAEEIEDLGKSGRRGISSHLAMVLEHLLKLQYTRALLRDYNLRGWSISVRSARRQLRKMLNESPSLRARLEELLADAYGDAPPRGIARPKLD